MMLPQMLLIRSQNTCSVVQQSEPDRIVASRSLDGRPNIGEDHRAEPLPDLGKRSQWLPVGKVCDGAAQL